MARTSTDLVQNMLGPNYDGVSDLQQWVDMAFITMNRVNTQSGLKGKQLGSDELEMVERLMACHYYTTMDPLFTQKSTAGASGGHPEPNQSKERYLDRAIALDYSGALKSIVYRQTATGLWLGKPVSQQIPYCERD